MKAFVVRFIGYFAGCVAITALVFGLVAFKGNHRALLHNLEPASLPTFLLACGSVCTLMAIVMALLGGRKSS